jgi:hypothetical protein
MHLSFFVFISSPRNLHSACDAGILFLETSRLRWTWGSHLCHDAGVRFWNSTYDPPGGIHRDVRTIAPLSRDSRRNRHTARHSGRFSASKASQKSLEGYHYPCEQVRNLELHWFQSLTVTSFALDGFFVRAQFFSFHNPKTKLFRFTGAM